MTLKIIQRQNHHKFLTRTLFPSLVQPYPTKSASVKIFILIFILLQSRFKSAYASSKSCEESPDHCTCSMRDTLEYFNKASVISRSILNRAPDAVSQRIRAFQCQKYEQLPDALVIKWSDVDDEYRMTKVRRLRRSHSRTVRNGPRLPRDQRAELSQELLPPMVFIKLPNDNVNRYEITSDHNHRRRRQRQVPIGYPSNELFGEVIPRLPARSSHRYIPLGAEAVLPCFGPEDIIEGNAWLERKFQWTHSSGRVVSASEMSIDKSSGDLTLKAVQLSDTDVYSCLVTYKEEESDEPQTLTYSQQLDVVAEPIAWLRFSVIYSADSCDHEEMTLIQESLVKWVHQYVCFFCPVRNNSVSCIFNGEGSSGNEGAGTYQDVRIRLAISTLGMEHRMTTFHSYSEACPLPCVESLHLKILQVARNSLEKLFGLEIDIEASQGKTSRYSPQRESLDTDLALGCPSGFFDNYKLCFPCPAGQYSPNGNSECVNCPQGHYQPTPGSAICFPCPTGYGTIGEGSMAEFDCKTEFFVSAIRSSSNWGTITLIILGILIPILLVVCLIPFFCPNTFLGRWFASCSCCGQEPDPDLGERRGSKDQNLKPEGGTEGYTKLQTEETTTDEEVEIKPVHDRRRMYEKNEESREQRGGGFSSVKKQLGLANKLNTRGASVYQNQEPGSSPNNSTGNNESKTVEKPFRKNRIEYGNTTSTSNKTFAIATQDMQIKSAELKQPSIAKFKQKPSLASKSPNSKQTTPKNRSVRFVQPVEVSPAVGNSVPLEKRSQGRQQPLIKANPPKSYDPGGTIPTTTSQLQSGGVKDIARKFDQRNPDKKLDTRLGQQLEAKAGTKPKPDQHLHRCLKPSQTSMTRLTPARRNAVPKPPPMPTWT